MARAVKRTSKYNTMGALCRPKSLVLLVAVRPSGNKVTLRQA